MSAERRIAANVAALTAARGGTMVMNLVLYAHLTRALGPERFGIIGWGTALLGLFSAFVEMGLGALYVREVARDPEQIHPMAGWLLGMRLILIAVAALALFLFLAVIDKPVLFKTAVGILGLSLVGGGASLDWAYHGTQRLGRLATRNVAVGVATLLATLWLVRSPADLLAAASVLSAGALLGSATIFPMFVREFGVPRPRIDRAQWKRLLRMAVPIGLSLFLLQIYAASGQFLLGIFRSDQEVGWYSGGYRVVLAALIGADILNQAFVPSLSSSLPTTDEGRASGAVYGTALAVVGLPIAVGGAVYARDVLVLFAGAEYAPGAPALALLLAYVAFSYIGKGYGDPLIAWDRERSFLRSVSLGAVLNVGLNVVLIPRYGLNGAAAAAAIASFAVAVSMAYVYRTLTGTVHAAARGRVLAAVVAGVLIPAAAAQACGWSLWAAVAVCIPAYVAALYGCRAVPTLKVLPGRTARVECL